jgi:putative glutamine amidotransferase
VAEAAVRQGVPLLGICRGAQMLNVACGGTLHQHIPDLVGHEHHNGTPTGFGQHKVRVTSGTIVSSILPGGEYFEVPTHHHQAVDMVGAGLTAVAWADDGIIEAIESTTPGEFLVGVQWHPEQGDDPRLFGALIAAADMHYSERSVASSLPPLLAGA